MVNAAKAKILVVDDEAAARDALGQFLGQVGYEVETAEDGIAAMARFAEFPADVVVTDLNMPNMDGVTLLTTLRALHPDVPVIVTTASGELRVAVAAMRAGADDYLTKPLDVEALTIAIERALECRSLRAETEKFRRQTRDRDGEGLHGMVGASAAMQKVYRLARRVARSRASVLITGERGTGKEEFARAIHALGNRSEKPFVSLHCGALTETPLEDALFGHESSGEEQLIGSIERADRGTIFFDEIGELPMATQVKLLGVLEERAIERIGGNGLQHVDVRVIAATSRDLAADVSDGRFRADLLARLNIVAIELPALRIRGGDTLVLANHFLRKFGEKNHARIDGFSQAAHAKLLAHPWPGNVRELEAVIERAVAAYEGNLVGELDLSFDSITEFRVL